MKFRCAVRSVIVQSSGLVDIVQYFVIPCESRDSSPVWQARE